MGAKSTRPYIQRNSSKFSVQVRSAVSTKSLVTRALIAASFCGAFLLFQVQPVISKIILPWFGGSPAVWTASMFFFQAVLLAGYCYAHALTRFLSLKFQVGVHLGLVITAIYFLPIYPSDSCKLFAGDGDPTWSVIKVLAQSVGVQFFLLSTTAPLTQVWWHRVSNESPYWLYAVSNAGSLIALISYPFFVEPSLGMTWQAFFWGVGFTFVALLVSVCSLASLQGLKSRKDEVRGNGPERADASLPEDFISWKRYMAWVFLSSCGSILLLSVTNHFSQNVAVVPFLWVMPLTVYLLSFILTFSKSGFYNRVVFGILMMLFTTFCAILYARDDLIQNVILLLTIHLTALFAGCMICHGELFRIRPSPHRLTSFYLAVSLGGAIGGLFVSLIAPLIFLQFYEYPIALMACWLIFITTSLSDKASSLYGGKPLWAWGIVVGLLVFFTYEIQQGTTQFISDAWVLRRNFYGVLSVHMVVKPEGPVLSLRNGTIQHGEQFLESDQSTEPTTYYAKSSGLGWVMDYFSDKEKRRVGMLGLGVGTIAAYSKQGDVFRAYEINPDVIELATNSEIFSFWELLKNRGAKGKIIEGDARISLEKEKEEGDVQNFDILVLDVFSGDAIPVHLLTRQAFSVYLDHLAENGVIVIHVSNRHLDLIPVVRDLAFHNGLGWSIARDSKTLSDWVIVGNERVLKDMVNGVGKQYRFSSLTTSRNVVKWTDDYSNIFEVLKF